MIDVQTDVSYTSFKGTVKTYIQNNNITISRLNFKGVNIIFIDFYIDVCIKYNLQFSSSLNNMVILRK